VAQPSRQSFTDGNGILPYDSWPGCLARRSDPSLLPLGFPLATGPFLAPHPSKALVKSLAAKWLTFLLPFTTKLCVYECFVLRALSCWKYRSRTVVIPLLSGGREFCFKAVFSVRGFWLARFRLPQRPPTALFLLGPLLRFFQNSL